MENVLGELLGTMFLVILNDGVVAGVLLARSKAENAGWIVITTGCGLGVMVGVLVALSAGSAPAHVNPAVTVASLLVPNSGITIGVAIPMIIAQLIGAFLGGVIVYLAYLPHWAVTADPGLKLAVFSTGPAIRNTTTNLITEIIGTFVLVAGVGAIFGRALGPTPATNLGPFLVGVLVWAIGLSLGGPTGFALNPARDLGPRIAHAVLPIPGKGGSDWEYGWVPVVGPVIGGIIGGIMSALVFAVA